MERIYEALERCRLFAAIGTSGHVYPAAGFVQGVGQDAHTVEMNLETSLVAHAFREHILGPASVTVPAWVDQLLEGLRR